MASKEEELIKNEWYTKSLYTFLTDKVGDKEYELFRNRHNLTEGQMDKLLNKKSIQYSKEQIEQLAKRGRELKYLNWDKINDLHFSLTELVTLESEFKEIEYILSNREKDNYFYFLEWLEEKECFHYIELEMPEGEVQE